MSRNITSVYSIISQIEKLDISTFSSPRFGAINVEVIQLIIILSYLDFNTKFLISVH